MIRLWHGPGWGALVLFLLLLAALPAAAQQARLKDITGADGGDLVIDADGALEWLRDKKQILAKGGAVATREDTAVKAETLIAHYREPTSGPDKGRMVIWRVEALGNVIITTPQAVARAGRAVYDVKKEHARLLGGSPRLESRDQTRKPASLTAGRALEYWVKRRVAQATGGVTLINGTDRLTAATMTAWLTAGSEGNRSAAGQEGLALKRAVAEGSPVAVTERGRLQGGRMEATFHRAPAGGTALTHLVVTDGVTVRTPDEVARADWGRYTAATEQAELVGNVRLTRGPNQLNGGYAVVDVKNGRSRLLARPPGNARRTPAKMPGDGRVRGLLVPKSAEGNGTP